MVQQTRIQSLEAIAVSISYDVNDYRTNTLYANCSGDRGSIQGRIIPKTLKVVLDTSLLNTQHYKVRIKGKVQQSHERSSTLP